MDELPESVVADQPHQVHLTTHANVFIERLWRSLKYEAVYLRDLDDGFEAQRVIGEWVEFYNETRPHAALGGRTSAEAYRDGVAEQQQEVAYRTGTAGGRHGVRRHPRANGSASGGARLSTYTQALSPLPG